jgi:hypothetical protein
MALNGFDRFAVWDSAKESLRLTWDHHLPYLVLVAVMMLPWAAMMAIGMFDALSGYAARMAENPQGYGLKGYPVGDLLILWAGAFFTMALFGIFWFRYMLLGREQALRFGPAEFNGMFWRTTGYGLAVVAIGLVLLFLAAVAGAITGGVIAAALGMVIGQAAMVVMLPVMLVVYALPLAVMVRLSLPFPAIALGQRLSLRESWSRTKGATWRIVGAMAAIGLPAALAGYALQWGLFYGLFGLNMWQPGDAALVMDHWWLTLILAPVTFASVALCFAIVAIAYRDLTRGGAAEAPAGARFAT